MMTQLLKQIWDKVWFQPEALRRYFIGSGCGMTASEIYDDLFWSQKFNRVYYYFEYVYNSLVKPHLIAEIVI